MDTPELLSFLANVLLGLGLGILFWAIFNHFIPSEVIKQCCECNGLATTIRLN